jgi:diguanylate cyclase (GGDEF)-like protein
VNLLILPMEDRPRKAPPGRGVSALNAARRTNPYVLIVFATIAIAAAVAVVSVFQQREASHAARQSANASDMLASMLDQETGLRGFALVPREAFLEPYVKGREDFARELRTSRNDLGDDGEARRLLDEQAEVAAAWQRRAERTVGDVRAGQRGVRAQDSLDRKALMDRFRVLNAEYRALVERRRDESLRTASIIAVVVVGFLTTLFAAMGLLLVRRRMRADEAREAAETDYRRGQDEFADMLAVADDEVEANALLKRHIERSTPDSRVVVLNRNNSEDRLEARTPLVADEPIAQTLEIASPRDCLAVRLGKPHAENPDSPPLLQCTVCGRSGASSTCVPLLVSGAVIGSVLVEHTGAFGAGEERRLHESVSQAAPVLANLRNLAIAEQRASTDVLTGLPNRRALQDTMKRMIAQASRTVTPLSVIAFDLDRFKRINDQHGHEQGDSVLAAVGEAVNFTIRASDFAGRNGGEEFLAILPDTTIDGARVVAEKLRMAIRATEVSGLDRPVTASFGLATFPVDAVDAESLIRVADRALYLAKHNGRDRVEAVSGENRMATDLDAQASR